jgi:hypothetical protein
MDPQEKVHTPIAEEPVSHPVLQSVEHSDPPAPEPVLWQPVIGGKRSRLKKILSTFFVLALLAAAGGFGYLWYTAQEELTTLKANNKVQAEGLVDTGSRGEATDGTSISDDPATAQTVALEYDKLIKLQAENPVDEAVNNTEILSALAAHYKMRAVPDDTTVLLVYQTIKPDTPPSGDLYALVYYPAADSKPSKMIEMVKAKDGKWSYNNLR